LNTPDPGPGTQRFAIEGWRVERHTRVGSTNDEARRRAVAGDPGRLWIVADEQTAGRGRQGRAWSSPAGNLYASAVVVDPCETAIAPQIGFVAGIALRRAVSELGDANVALKWPNDLVSNGAKLAGLLVEGLMTPERRLVVIAGFGVNLASSPQDLSYSTTDLSRLLERPVHPSLLIERLARRFDEALTIWDRGNGFAAIRETWLASAAGLGGPIRVSGPRGEREGIFSGIDPQGRLLLHAGDRIETVESADLTLISSSSRAVDALPPKRPSESLPV
jgi:BirA family transcriptional regulator, biotin operon repressor / biotin---[acetyl-CoA-carboxylase] ligase